MSLEHTSGSGAVADSGCGPLWLDQVAAASHAVNYIRQHLEHTVLLGAKLTWTGYDILHVTVMHRPIDTAAVAAITGVSKGTVTRAATDLIKRGLLRRTRPENDRRRAVLAPTNEGWTLNQHLRSDLIVELNWLLKAAPSAGRNHLGLLRNLIAVPKQAGSELRPEEPNP